MEKGKVIFLNGASSSGKTTLANNLRLSLEEPYLYLGLDTFITMLPLGYIGQVPPADQCMQLIPFVDKEGHNQVELKYGPKGRILIKSMYETVRILANNGWNVICDDVCFELQEVAKILDRLEVILISVYAPLTVLEERELARKNRLPGLARWQFPKMYPSNPIYDLEIDTSKGSIEESVQAIKEFLKNGKPAAFKKIKSS